MNNPSTYSVSTLTSIYSQSLSSSLDAQIISLEGFYSDKQGKLYGNCYYDKLQDKNKITIQLTETLKSKLTSVRYYYI